MAGDEVEFLTEMRDELIRIHSGLLQQPGNFAAMNHVIKRIEHRLDQIQRLVDGYQPYNPYKSSVSTCRCGCGGPVNSHG